ncbi:MAG: hypothetical protein NXH85_18015 [Pseudomonadaceae bacterium]|nr:hypothetical protein [Pseudomonadaceae bacterium]
MDNEQLCEAFFTGTANADANLLRNVCSSAFTGSQNDGPAMPLEALIKFSAITAGAVNNFHYENVLRGITPDGFVEEHDVCCDLPDGSEFRMRLCCVGSVSEGEITSVREYFDSRGASGLLKALAG